MVSLDCHTAVAGDATLVRLHLASEEPTHVRVENCLDGPVWPPRCQGVPEAGWDDDGFAGVVEGRLALGYATPADPSDPPVRVVDERPPDDGESLSPESLVRQLGDAAPPRDAVGPAVTGSDDWTTATDETPPALAAWLDAIENRLDDADRLGSATSVADATDAVDAVGGPEDVRALRAQIAADRRVLRAVAARCETLAERAEAAEIPVETLARLA